MCQLAKALVICFFIREYNQQRVIIGMIMLIIRITLNGLVSTDK